MELLSIFKRLKINYNKFNDNYVYRDWKDSINRKAQKYIKPTIVLEDEWDEKTNKTKKKWVSHPFESYNSWVLDSVYQHFNLYEKSQIDSARRESVNSYIDEKRKQLDYKLPLHFSELMRRDISKVLDTCSNIFFNNQQWTYLDILKFQSYDFEKQFKQQQLLSVLSSNEKIKYRDYLAEIILMMPLHQRTPIINMEVGLYYRRDSLTHDFLSQLSPRNKRIYEEMIAFFINNIVDKQYAATKAGDYKWNKQTRKYSEIEKYASRGFLDTVFFYADSIIAKREKNKYNFTVIYNVLNNGLYNSVFPDVYWSMENWKSSKDTFFFEMNTKKINGEYIAYVNRKMRRDSIPIDTVFKWKVENTLMYIGREAMLELDSSIINCYKKYRDTKITDQDSTFLDNVYTRCGYLRDSSEHSRLFFHANAYYLYLADITINKSRAFLAGWNPLYLSTSHKLAIIVLSFLMFFTTLANSNLFTAVFVAFFINFVNNTIFNLGQNFQEIDKSKQTFWLFGLLGILALLTAVNVLFRKFKLPIIYLLINIQLFALLGIFVWLFDSQTIEQQSNYGYLAIVFWGLMVWKYRSYLALPSKK